MAVARNSSAASPCNAENPNAIGRKNAVSDPAAAPTASAAKTAKGFSADASNNAGKKLPVTNAAGSSNNKATVGPRDALKIHTRITHTLLTT